MGNLAFVVLEGGISTQLAETDVGNKQVHRLNPDDLAAWDRIADRGGTVVVIAPSHLERRARHMAAIASDRGLRVALRLCALGPLALLLIARNAAHVTPGPGTAPLSFDAISSATWSGAWTPTVTKLNQPAPSILQHVRSMLPSDGYIVELGDTPRVTAVRKLRKQPHPHPSTRTPRGPLVSAGNLPDHASSIIATHTGHEGVFVMEPATGGHNTFGNSAAVELAVLPQHDPTPAVELVACPSCNLHVPQPVCPYCRVRAGQFDQVGAIA